MLREFRPYARLAALPPTPSEGLRDSFVPSCAALARAWPSSSAQCGDDERADAIGKRVRPVRENDVIVLDDHRVGVAVDVHPVEVQPPADARDIAAQGNAYRRGHLAAPCCGPW